ncbi:hypothetical protein [Tenacibaculum phage Larrie]|nr:hypothetical protein [Tenacibaculum phage Larrie]
MADIKELIDKIESVGFSKHSTIKHGGKDVETYMKEDFFLCIRVERESGVFRLDTVIKAFTLTSGWIQYSSLSHFDIFYSSANQIGQMLEGKVEKFFLAKKIQKSNNNLIIF